jgi:hypothetical protein
LDFNALLARLIAAIIVAVITVIIASTGIGAIVLAIIGLIDALIALTCAIIEEANQDQTIDKDVKKWVCGGIMASITEAIVYLIYEQAPLADLQANDRLDIAMFTPTFARGAGSAQAGIMISNTVTLGLSITNTLSMASPTGFRSQIAEWTNTFFTDANLKKTNYSYTLQSSKTDQHSSLQQGVSS